MLIDYTDFLRNPKRLYIKAIKPSAKIATEPDSGASTRFAILCRPPIESWDTSVEKSSRPCGDGTNAWYATKLDNCEENDPSGLTTDSPVGE